MNALELKQKNTKELLEIAEGSWFKACLQTEKSRHNTVIVIDQNPKLLNISVAIVNDC